MTPYLLETEHMGSQLPYVFIRFFLDTWYVPLKDFEILNIYIIAFKVYISIIYQTIIFVFLWNVESWDLFSLYVLLLQAIYSCSILFQISGFLCVLLLFDLFLSSSQHRSQAIVWIILFFRFLITNVRATMIPLFHTLTTVNFITWEYLIIIFLCGGIELAVAFSYYKVTT